MKLERVAGLHNVLKRSLWLQCVEEGWGRRNGRNRETSEEASAVFRQEVT